MQTYSFKEFKAIKEDVQKVDFLNSHKLLITSAMLTVGFIFVFGNGVFASNGLDAGGMKILKQVRSLAYWVIMIKYVLDIAKAYFSGERHKLGEHTIHAVMAYGALFLLPYLLDMVQEVF